MFFDKEGTLKPSKKSEFIAEISGLKEKYKDKIELLCGIEQDTCSDVPPDGFDYVIGDVHYFEKDGVRIALDNGEDLFVSAVDKLFGGDFLLAAENYYQRMSEVVAKTNADYIGHFDLIEKYNENCKYFDSHDPRYVQAYQKAADELLKYNRPFEINVGAMLTKGKAEPYPSRDIIEYIKSKGGKFILNSDSHSVSNLKNSALARKQNEKVQKLAQYLGE